MRKFGLYQNLKKNLENSYDVGDMDLSGRTKYTNCISHQFVIDTMTKTKHGRLGSWFQRQFMYSTLMTSIVFGIVAGLISVFIGLFIVSSVLIAGGGIAVLFFGVLLAVGPGGPKFSETLLGELMNLKSDELGREDYPYVRIAMNSVTSWTTFAMIVGFVFLVSAPWAGPLSELVVGSLAMFGESVLWSPMVWLMQIWPPFGAVYISLMIPFIFIIIPGTLYFGINRIRA
jgi:hypothetical protein